MDSINSDQALLNEATRQLADDFALGRILREKIAEGLLRLPVDDPAEIANSLRALNSASSALATAQKIGRTGTGIDNLADHDAKLPVLEIREMSSADIERVKDNLQRERSDKESEMEDDEQAMLH